MVSVVFLVLCFIYDSFFLSYMLLQNMITSEANFESTYAHSLVMPNEYLFCIDARSNKREMSLHGVRCTLLLRYCYDIISLTVHNNIYLA